MLEGLEWVAYPLKVFNCVTIDIWEMIRNFIPYCTGHSLYHTYQHGVHMIYSIKESIMISQYNGLLWLLCTIARLILSMANDMQQILPKRTTHACACLGLVMIMKHLWLIQIDKIIIIIEIMATAVELVKSYVIFIPQHPSLSMLPELSLSLSKYRASGPQHRYIKRHYINNREKKWI